MNSIVIFSAILSVASLVTTVFIAFIVYRFNRNSIRFQNTRYLIESWQTFNKFVISDEKHIHAVRSFYEKDLTAEEIPKLYILFTLLNILQHEYFSAKHGMADESLALGDIRDQINKLKADKDFILKSIEGRGFEGEFIKYLRASISG